MQIDLDAATPTRFAPSPDPSHRAGTDEQALRGVARDLEASFLAEMLKHAGLDGTGGAFSGGPGAEQFGSFLRAEQARLFAERGGIGLAESIFQALAARTDVP